MERPGQDLRVLGPIVSLFLTALLAAHLKSPGRAMVLPLLVSTLGHSGQ